MTDPVIDPNGNRYERAAIENWVKQHSTSPITNTPLSLGDLHPNLALREKIEEYRSKISTSNNTSKVNATDSVKEQTFELKVTSSWINNFVHISIQPPEGIGIRAPCDICCVVDISGSMTMEVEIQTAHHKEKSGLSQLGLCKHALKTIIHSLTQNDRLSIVSFSNKASIVLELRQMNDDGRSRALAVVENLFAIGFTNLWDGLKTGLNTLMAEQRTSGSNAALFLLTDGCPSDRPTGGHLSALAEYKTENNFTCSINTFGFGYDLNSQLLENLAQMGNSGSYAFIPDGSFVGTVFVNAISNLLATTATNLQLSVEGINIQPSIDSLSNYISNYSTPTLNHKVSRISKIKTAFFKLFVLDNSPSNESGLRLNLGSVIFGQSKDIVIPMTIEQYNNLDIILDYESPYGQKKKQCTSVRKLDGNIQLFNQQKHRLDFVHFVRKGYELLCSDEYMFSNNQQKILNDIQVLEKTIKKDSINDNYLTDLLKDLTGQVTEAFSRRDWFQRWGIHYLLSITRAHLLQQCNNFKDPGVQHYGQGELFNSIRDEMDTIFCNLPAPKVNRKVTSSSGVSNSHFHPTIDMSNFNNSNNPCFHGSCTVKLLDGSIKFVKDIQRGDRLYPHGGTVNYVLRTICSNAQAQMVLLNNGLMITPWHPIRLNGIQWIFPCSLVSSPTNIICESVYSFALDREHTIWVNDVECVTLGHAFKDDIVRHVYYGSKRVIKDLRIMDEQQRCTGFIEIQSNWIIRNKRTGLVNGIRQPQYKDFISDQ